MDEKADIQFIPSRINQAPIVYKGLTGQEIIIVITLGATIGMLVGVMMMFTFNEIALVPTMIFVCALILLQVGGSVVRQFKRGKPSTWMYRSIQYSFAKTGMPILGGADIIVRSEVFSTSTRRNVKAKKRIKS